MGWDRVPRNRFKPIRQRIDSPSIQDPLTGEGPFFSGTGNASRPPAPASPAGLCRLEYSVITSRRKYTALSVVLTARTIMVGSILPAQ